MTSASMTWGGAGPNPHGASQNPFHQNQASHFMPTAYATITPNQEKRTTYQPRLKTILPTGRAQFLGPYMWGEVCETKPGWGFAV
jgi:hypothetical protein